MRTIRFRDHHSSLDRRSDVLSAITSSPSWRALITAKTVHLFLFAQIVAVPLFAYGQNPPEPFRTHVVEVEDGVDLHIVDWGGEGPALLFIPSWSSTSHTFDLFAPKFSDSYHVLVMNARGHGPSSKPDDGYTIDRLTKDIEVVLDELKVPQATLVSLSRSASITTQFAAKYPNRVSSLIYLSGPIDRAYERDFMAKEENRSAAGSRSRLDDAILELCGINFERSFPPGSDDEEADALGTEWRSSDPRPPYSDIAIPALAFWSPITDLVLRYQNSCSHVDDQDRVRALLEDFNRAQLPFYEKSARDMAVFSQLVEDSKIVVSPGPDYNTFLTHPDLVEEQMRLFLSGKVGAISGPP